MPAQRLNHLRIATPCIRPAKNGVNDHGASFHQPAQSVASGKDINWFPRRIDDSFPRLYTFDRSCSPTDTPGTHAGLGRGYPTSSPLDTPDAKAGLEWGYFFPAGA
jgi:hypothetical protein